ncbi:MAG: NAD(P)/FAD-dependent oxidoreductase [Verrucomicrobiaceae bacterium]
MGGEDEGQEEKEAHEGEMVDQDGSGENEEIGLGKGGGCGEFVGVTIEVIGFGLAGACVALRAQERGLKVRVVDDGVGGSTEVAAGLVNPVAGRNFQPSWMVREYWAEALPFYEELDGEMYHAVPILRKWIDGKDRAKFEKKREVVADWVDEVSEEGVLWKGGGWLETRRFLAVARERFLARGGVISAEQGEAEVRVWCTGARGLIREEFEGVAHRSAKGEILTVRVPGWGEERILNRSGWLIPIGGDCYRVGATYEWDGLETGPSEKGRARVEEILRSFTDREYEVVGHVAGIRPIIQQSRPVTVYEEGKGWMLNGLGSKGVIYAPGVARELVEKVVSQWGAGG